MRALTKKELRYVQRLFERNSKLLRGNHLDAERLFCQGLETPMPASERKARERIRRKVVAMAFDLARVYAAGIMPCKRGRALYGEKSATGLVEKTSNFLSCLMVTGSKDEAIRLFQYVERLAGHG